MIKVWIQVRSVKGILPRDFWIYDTVHIKTSQNDEYLHQKAWFKISVVEKDLMGRPKHLREYDWPWKWPY